MHVDVCKGKVMECLLLGGSGVRYHHTYKHTLLQMSRGVERFLYRLEELIATVTNSTGRSINSHAWDYVRIYICDSLEINDRLVIVGKGFRSGVPDVRVMRGADIGSDCL